MNKHGFLVATLAVIGLLGGPALAQSYPTRGPVRIVVPFPPGGSFDVTARLLAQQLTEQTKHSFIVENRAGASGYIGAGFVSDSKPDGYTLLYAGSSLTITPALTPNVPIDITRDLTAITKVVNAPYVVVISPDIPARDTNSLVAWIKQHPNDFKWAISALGSADHLGAEVFNKMTGIPEPLSIPYQGTSVSTTAVMKKEVSALMAPVAVIKGLVDSGDLRAIGVTSLVPIDAMPNVPPIANQLPGYEAGAWGGVFGPKDMPADLTLQIHSLIVSAVMNPALQEKIKAGGSIPEISNRPQDFADRVKVELAKYSAIVKDLNLKVSQ